MRRYTITLWLAGTYQAYRQHQTLTHAGARRSIRASRKAWGDTFDYTITDTWTGRHEHA